VPPAGVIGTSTDGTECSPTEEVAYSPAEELVYRPPVKGLCCGHAGVGGTVGRLLPAG
jgi:hypothetical protein